MGEGGLGGAGGGGRAVAGRALPHEANGLEVFGVGAPELVMSVGGGDEEAVGHLRRLE